MNPQAYALLGVTALTAVLVAVVAWALLRFISAARDTRHRLRDAGESPLLTIALQEGIQKLRAQERAMTERAEASEALGTQIVNSLTAGLLVVDRQGQVQILNPAGRKMLGITNGVEGVHIDTLPAAAAPLAGVVNECLTTGHPIVRRALEVPQANDVTHVGVTASRFGQSESAAGGVICLFSDLTAVVELEEQLRLKEALARLGEMTAGIAHEFRNGLATIHGYGKLIDPSLVPPQYKPYVEGIRQETEALGQVVTNFLNFARPTQLSLATQDLAALVQRAADDLRHEIHQMGGEIVVTGQFGRVDADDVLLRQAVSNLLRNGVDACAAVGKPPRLEVRGRIDAASQTVQVSVSDDGPGIAPEAMPRLFQPFFTTRPGGTGLGLAIVQKVLVSHNGWVTAANRAEGGATLTIHLPRHAAENGTEP